MSRTDGRTRGGKKESESQSGLDRVEQEGERNLREEQVRSKSQSYQRYIGLISKEKVRVAPDFTQIDLISKPN